MNFKASVHEHNTVINVSDLASIECDYPSGPLEDERPSSTADLVCVAPPFPEQATQQAPIAIPQPASGSMANRVEPFKARTKRVSKKKASHKRVPSLERPLSETPNSNGSDPLEEITQYAHRSVQRRQKEAEVFGRVKRPSNKFLLYRKAYYTTIQTTDLKSASLIIAESWATESNELRNYFTGLANTDTMLHKEAFPGHIYTRQRALRNEDLEELDE